MGREHTQHALGPGFNPQHLISQAGKSGVQDHPPLHSDPEASMGHVRSGLKGARVESGTPEGRLKLKEGHWAWDHLQSF